MYVELMEEQFAVAYNHEVCALLREFVSGGDLKGGSDTVDCVGQARGGS